MGEEGFEISTQPSPRKKSTRKKSRKSKKTLDSKVEKEKMVNAKLLALKGDLRRAENKLKSGERSAFWWGDGSVFPFGYDVQPDKDKVRSIKSEIVHLQRGGTALQTSIGNINAAMVAEENLDYRKAIDLFDQVGLGSEAKRIRKKMTDEGKVKVDQTVVHGDYIDDRDTIIKDSVVSKSSIGAGGDDNFVRLEKLTEMKKEGLITDEEFEKMKRNIIG